MRSCAVTWKPSRAQPEPNREEVNDEGNVCERKNWWIGPYVPAQPRHDSNLTPAERAVQDAVYFASEMEATEREAWALLFKEAWTSES